jgi:hypothetical protein
LPWAGGEPETWAYAYFDRTPTGPGDLVGPPDLLATSALHPGFGRAEMDFFRGRGGDESCEQWLSALPVDVDLADADEETVEHLTKLPRPADAITLSVLSKVLHRKRPRLVPLFDRAIVDWYRPVTGRRGEEAWPELVRSLRSDQAIDQNREVLADITGEIAAELAGPVPSALRLVDMAIWMNGRTP